MMPSAMSCQDGTITWVMRVGFIKVGTRRIWKVEGSDWTDWSFAQSRRILVTLLFVSSQTLKNTLRRLLQCEEKTMLQEGPGSRWGQKSQEREYLWRCSSIDTDRGDSVDRWINVPSHTWLNRAAAQETDGPEMRKMDSPAERMTDLRQKDMNRHTLQAPSGDLD